MEPIILLKELEKTGVSNLINEEFIVIDTSIVGWETAFEPLIKEHDLEGNTIDCISEERTQYVIYNVEFAWCEYASDVFAQIIEYLEYLNL